VRIFWERYGAGEPTLLLLPTWSIVHSRIWKMQIPYLARHFRVVTFDGRGNGKSDRPAETNAYLEKEFAADALAVMDASVTDQAVLVSISVGSQRALVVASEQSERVLGLVFLGPSLPIAPGHPGRYVHDFEEPLDAYEGWAKFNRHYWALDYEGFLEFFFSHCLTEPHSTKQIEDAVGWGLDTNAETMTVLTRAPWLTEDEVRDRCARVACPVLVVHGDRDAISPHERGVRLAEATRGQVVTIAGGGHLPNARDPVKVNLLIREFVQSLP
jgi:pimeloyl-ACP methyl ester carboxylesterase